MKNAIKIFIIITIFNNLIIKAQNIKSHLSKIENNILIYRINNTKLDQLMVGINNEGNLYKQFLPKKNEVLDIKYSKSTNLDLEGYTLFALKTNSYTYKNKDSINSNIIIPFKYLYDKLFDSYLIGIKNDKSKLIYISGAFYKNPIKTHFNLSIKNPNTFKFFIQLKLFNYQINQINFIKKKKKCIIFEAYSKTIKEHILIEIDNNNFDFFTLKQNKTKLPLPF